MVMQSRAGLAVALIAASVVASLLVQPLAIAQSGRRTPEPGEGVICAWALYSVAAEVGRRCFPGQNVEVNEELVRSVARIDAFVIANTDPQTTKQQIDEFKRQQGGVGADQESLCRGDAVQIYRSLAAQGALEIRRSIDTLVSRPGSPTWGTCL
ncbi:MAG: hypothetical protein GC189_10000 [Alphaproteobacteria bacterium]|nr:hypothetical protein [Alphaproteobacteria bacterium]